MRPQACANRLAKRNQPLIELEPDRGTERPPAMPPAFALGSSCGRLPSDSRRDAHECRLASAPARRRFPAQAPRTLAQFPAKPSTISSSHGNSPCESSQRCASDLPDLDCLALVKCRRRDQPVDLVYRRVRRRLLRSAPVRTIESMPEGSPPHTFAPRSSRRQPGEKATHTPGREVETSMAPAESRTAVRKRLIASSGSNGTLIESTGICSFYCTGYRERGTSVDFCASGGNDRVTFAHHAQGSKGFATLVVVGGRAMLPPCFRVRSICARCWLTS